MEYTKKKQKKPIRYVLTPRRKKIGKAVARRFNTSVVDECLKQPETRQSLLKKLLQLLRKELKEMCSDGAKSILQDKSARALGSFTWKNLTDELALHAPILLHILCGCTITRKPRDNRSAVIGLCASILLHYRLPKMSLVQRILSIVLYSGHSAKQVC